MQLRLVCVGVTQLDERVACLLMMQRGKAVVTCVELDRASSLFVSPLYEHTLGLRLSERRLSKAARARLALLGCESLHEVMEWPAWQCLLQDNLSATLLPKRLHALLAHSLFIQSAHVQPPGDTALLRQFYAPRARDTTLCSSESLLGVYFRDLMAQADKERRKGQALGVAFWQQVAARDEVLLQDAVDRLFGYARKTAVYPTMADVATLLLGWRLPCARFIAHKIDLMPTLHQLCKLTRQPAGQPLAHCGAFAQFNTSLLRASVTHDALTLISLLWAHMTQDEAVEDQVISDGLFAQYRQLVDWCLLDGGLGRLLDALYAKKREFAERCVVLRRRLLMRLVLPLLVASLELHVTRQSQAGRSTLECLTVRTLYLAYAELFRAGGEKSARPTVDEQLFALQQEDDTRPASKRLYEFDLIDFNLALSALHRTLQDGAAPWRAQYVWRARPLYDDTPLLAKTVLFYVETQPALLRAEAQISAHYEKHWYEALLSVALCESHELGALFDERNEEEQQYRLVCFDPVELRESADLVFVRELALSDLYATTLLRESSTNQFFKERLERAFAGELDAAQWYEELYFETPNFRTVDQRALRRTVIVADAHLLTSNDLLAALRWLTFHRATIKRVVLCGSLDLAPLSQNGQPFCDLLLRIDAQRVRRHAYSEERRARLMDGLLGAWTLHRWPDDNDRRTRFAHHHDWTQRPALYVLRDETMEALEDLFYRLQRYRRFTLHCLYRTERPALQPRKKSLLRVVPLQLDALMQHQRISPDDEAFVLLWSDALRLSRNQATLLLSTLERLFLIGCPEADPAQALREHYAKDTRPTLRYTQSAMK